MVKNRPLIPRLSPLLQISDASINEIKVVHGNTAFNEALIQEPPRAFTPAACVLYAACLVGFLCSTMNGYDGSLLNGLLSNPSFRDYFHGSNDGLWAGIVSSIYQIGGVVALPFVGPALDMFGRRAGMFAGSIIIVLGTVVQGTTSVTGSLSQFMGGRFLLGFGVSLATSAGPVYVVEACHPAHRGAVTALYNTFWFTGSIISSGAVRGALDLGGIQSWLIPVWLQLLCSGIVIVFVFFLPESPRWLYVNGRPEAAKDMIVWFHGNGNQESAWVKLQLREYEEFLQKDGADKRWWDYRALFATRASRYRLACNMIVSVFGQWAGNAVLSYFLSAVLDTAGITDAATQLNINLGLAFAQFTFAILGALSVDKIGRRNLLLFANGALCLVWVGMSAATGVFAADKGNVDAARATQAFVYLFGIVFAFGFTPLQALYPVEVLSFEMRAKGMAFSSFAMNLASLLNQFAWPISLEAIGWKTYLIFVVWCAFQTVVVYMFIPETKNRTLEELDLIFEAKNPCKASLEKKEIALDGDRNVVQVATA